MQIPHIPVLKEEVLEAFKDSKEGVIIDCTLGFGGHTQALLDSYPHIKIIGIDKDSTAREFSQNRLKDYKDRIEILDGSFGEVLGSAIESQSKIVGILADIGVSSLQLDDKERGFGFGSHKLDMRMNTQNILKASDVINTYPQDRLEKIFREYGEIRESKKLANLIVEQRKNQPFNSGVELSNFIAKHFKKAKIHPATLAFQAIRIEVNDELGELNRGLDSIFLAKEKLDGALIAFISFHSLEDRVIKEKFREWEKKCICPSHYYKCECGGQNAIGKIITKKPITPQEKETKANPRARSSKMRIFKIGERN